MCYDQMLQTQKRDLIKRILDCAIGRMLEFKKEIARFSYTEYQYAYACAFPLVASFIISNLRRNIV